MKHYDTDVKKFIKNVVSLVVSAMLLIAATIAWFAQSETAHTGTLSAAVRAPVNFVFRKATVDSNSFFDTHSVSNNGTTTVSYVIKTRSADNNNATTPAASIPGTALSTFIPAVSTWIETQSDGNGNRNWDLSSMYPGEFGLYRVDYTSDNSARELSLEFASGITSVNRNALKCIYVYALATYVDENDAQQVIVQQTKSLDDLLYPNGATTISSTTVSALTGINAASGKTIYVYYLVGMPADGPGLKALQDAVRVLNAPQKTSLSISSIQMVSGS